MEGSVKQLPPDATMVALLTTTKTGFDSHMVSSLIYGISSGGFRGCMFAFYGDYPTSHARNAAAADAIRRGAKWLFFIDSDMDFPVNVLDRLKALDADIACTDMWSRSWPSFRTVLEYGEKSRDGKKQLFPVAMNAKVTGPRSIDSCGMACTLIKVDLLKKFDKKKIMPFATSNHGEDAYFCMVARDKFKASMKCDFDVVAGHWGRARMVGQDFTRDARNQIGAVADPEQMKRMGAVNVDEVAAERGYE